MDPSTQFTLLQSAGAPTRQTHHLDALQDQLRYQSSEEVGAIYNDVKKIRLELQEMREQLERGTQ